MEESDGKRAVFDGDGWVGKAEEEGDNELEWEKCVCCLAEDASCEVFFSNNTQDENNNPALSVLRMRAKRYSLRCI